MSDGTMNEKIERALSADEWAVFRHHDGWTLYDAQFSGTLRLTTDDAESLEVRSPDAMIALANQTLPEDDPRKITREWVTSLRMWSRGHEIEPEVAAQMADALESYLPPEKP